MRIQYEHLTIKDILSKSMEEPLFVKCEPAWSSDTEEEPSNLEQDVTPPPDSQVKIKEDPHAMVVRPSLEEVDADMVKEHCSDEDEVEEAHNEECDNSGGSSHDVKNAAVLSGEVVHSCEYCCKEFKQRCHLERHLPTHTGETPYCCTTCNRTFKHQSTLKNHQLTHSAARPFKCKVCGNAFKRSASLRRHQNTHTDSRPFTCSICGNKFRQATHLRMHENYTH